MSGWARLWHDMPTDPKWRVISKRSGRSISEVMAVFIFMMTNASANADERGRTKNLNAEDIAAALDLETGDIDAILSAMEGKVIENGFLSGWEKRQPKREDNSAERARKWREERKRTQANAVERPDIDIDSEIDIEKEPKGSKTKFDLPDWVNGEAWDGYVAMRKKIGKPMTDRAKALAVGKLEAFRDEGYDPAKVLDQSTAASWQGLFAVKGDYDGGNNNQRGGYSGAERDNRTGFERACDRIIEQSADSDQRREDAGVGSNRLLPSPDSPAML